MSEEMPPIPSQGMSDAQREKIRQANEAATDWRGTFRCCGKEFVGRLCEVRNLRHVCEKQP